MKKWRMLICICVIMLLCTGCKEAVLETIEDVRSAEYIEVTVDEHIFEDKFYYSQLSEEEQLIYREIYQGVLDHCEEIVVHGEDPSYVNRILEPIVYDFPALFWIDGASRTTSYEDTVLKEGYSIVKPEYLYSKQESDQRTMLIEQEANSVLQALPDEFGDYEKIKFVYDYLVEQLEYVDGAPDNQNICSSLIQKETVCAGYAKAMQYLLNEMGMECIYVLGEVTDETGTDGHAWNIVNCNGKYYHVDVTWADPVTLEQGSEIKSARIYDYLLCSESEIAETHVMDVHYSYPECVSDDLNYYRLQNAYFETVDDSVLLKRMKESIREKAEYVTFKFSEEVYTEARNLIVDKLAGKAAEYLCQRYGLWQVQYFYEENEMLNRVTLYWQYK